MYPENLNIIGQQTSEIFEFKKRLEERKEKKELPTESVQGLPLKTEGRNSTLGLSDKNSEV